MNIAICDRYDTDVARINELLDANIKRHMLNHALLEVDTFTSTDELLASLICPLSSRQVKYLKVSDKNTYISFWSVGIFMHTISLYIF